MAALLQHEWLTLAVFAVSVTFLLGLDLYKHRDHSKPVSLGNAAAWSVFYVVAALGFAYFIAETRGSEDASLFLSGYVMEKILSVDNLLVFVAIFSYFKIPARYQHKILHWGILGAIVFRLLFVATLWTGYYLYAPYVGIIFGGMILWSAVAMWKSGGDDNDEEDYENKWYIRWVRYWYPVTTDMSSGRFFVPRTTVFSKDGKKLVMSVTTRSVTPLFLALVAVEISDIMFSFDSVPVVIAITQDPALVYSAMIFAILGLRSLYFVLSALLRFLAHLEKAVIAILFFVGVKLLVHSANELLHIEMWEPTPLQSLTVVLSTLTIGIVASLIWPDNEEKA